jgi:hypothetical protein
MPERDWSLLKHTACYVYILTKSSAGNKYKIRPEPIVFMHSYGSSGSGFCGLGIWENAKEDFPFSLFINVYLTAYILSAYTKRGREEDGF